MSTPIGVVFLGVFADKHGRLKTTLLAFISLCVGNFVCCLTPNWQLYLVVRLCVSERSEW